MTVGVGQRLALLLLGGKLGVNLAHRLAQRALPLGGLGDLRGKARSRVSCCLACKPSKYTTGSCARLFKAKSTHGTQVAYYVLSR